MMRKKLVVTNLLPTYNEKENIGKLLLKLSEIERKNRKYKFQTLVVDDNSPDGTADIVKKYMRNHKNVYLLSHKKEGLGKAMIRGTKYCIKNLKSDVIISNEADFSYDFNKIKLMLKKIDEGMDVVVASRHIGKAKIYGWKKMRMLNHFVSNFIFARIIAGSRLSDNNGAYRAIRVKNVMSAVNLNELNVRGYSFFNYSLYKLSRVTNKIYEFPSNYNSRTKGESKISMRYLKTYFLDSVEYIRVCIKIRIERITG